MVGADFGRVVMLRNRLERDVGDGRDQRGELCVEFGDLVIE